MSRSRALLRSISAGARSLSRSLSRNHRSLSSRSYTSDCNSKPPTCMEGTLTKSPCNASIIKRGSAKPKTMWEEPECCVLPCDKVTHRFDELYYRPRPWQERKYIQTWKECPDEKISMRKVCMGPLRYPPIQRRSFSNVEAKKQGCALPLTAEAKRLMSCKTTNSVSLCPRVEMKGCRPARIPPICDRSRRPAKCVKICTPMPSFSECVKDPPNPKRVEECNCLAIVSNCDYWNEYRKRFESNMD